MRTLRDTEEFGIHFWGIWIFFLFCVPAVSFQMVAASASSREIVITKNHVKLVIFVITKSRDFPSWSREVYNY